MYQVRLKESGKDPVWIVPPKLSIGCANDNDVVLKKDGIKQHHADLIIKGNNIYLLPDESANDVLINGRQINQSHPLKKSDVIRLCNTELEILEPKAEDHSHDIIQDSVSDKWYVEIISGAPVGQRYPLKKSNIIGRSPDCEIQFPEDSISRKHARLDIIGGALKITDMGSANGCMINGTKITSAYARPGDVLKIGQMELSISGPFLDTDKTVISAPSGEPLLEESPKKTSSAKAESNTFIRREQILESKQALQSLNNNSDNKNTKPLIWISAIILTLAILSSALLISF
jgi:pSer/pThr/pTyr-binding forkhead associated (FHA) protein